jgi:SAM-dependent methyltransferase
MKRYEFSERRQCFCGAPLASALPSVTVRFGQDDIRFRRCQTCGSHVQAPQLAADSLAAWFDSPAYQGGGGVAGSAYVDYAADESTRLREGQARARRDLLPFLPSAARVFEIGCGSGSVLAALAQAGHRVAGCDLSSRFVELGRRSYGLDIALADYSALDLAPKSADAVLIYGTFGNLRNLPAVLARAAEHLAPQGLLFANFPAADSWTARLYGSRHWMFAPSISQFPTRAGVRMALTAAGFGIVDMTRDMQRPSFAKLAKHAKIPGLPALLRRWGLAHRPLPIAFPIPGVFHLRARKSAD